MSSEQTISLFRHPFEKIDPVRKPKMRITSQYLQANPNFVMANVLGGIQSALTGLGNTEEYYNRLEETLSQDPNRMHCGVWIRDRKGLYKE